MKCEFYHGTFSAASSWIYYPAWDYYVSSFETALNKPNIFVTFSNFMTNVV